MENNYAKPLYYNRIQLLIQLYIKVSRCQADCQSSKWGCLHHTGDGIPSTDWTVSGRYSIPRAAKLALTGQAVPVCKSAHPPTATPSLQSARHYSWHVSVRRLLGTVQQKAAVAPGPMQSWFRWKHQWDHFLSGEGAVRPTPGGHLRRGGWPGSIALNLGWPPA